MTDWIDTEELRAPLRRPTGRGAGRDHDRDVARLSPWRRHRGRPDTAIRGE